VYYVPKIPKQNISQTLDQEVSLRLFTAQASIQSQASPRGVCENAESFLRILRFFHVTVIPPQDFNIYFIHLPPRLHELNNWQDR